MAAYSFNAKILQRSKGQSLIAHGAYISCSAIFSERTGETSDYHKKKGLLGLKVYAPANAPDWIYDKSKLFNSIDMMEKRQDAQLARTLTLALPHELTLTQQQDLLDTFCKRFADKGTVALSCIHDAPEGGDKRNVHAHIILATRGLLADKPPFWGQKLREWNNKETLLQWRKDWAEDMNQALEAAGVPERVSHLSLKEQGLNRTPTLHEGPYNTMMRRMGEEAPRAADNDNIKANNEDKGKEEQLKRDRDALKRREEEDLDDREKFVEGLLAALSRRTEEEEQVALLEQQTLEAKEREEKKRELERKLEQELERELKHTPSRSPSYPSPFDS